MQDIFKKIQAHNTNFGRIARMTEPQCIIAVGLVFSLFSGTVMPIFGVILSKLLFGLDAKINSLDKVRENANFYCLMMLICGISSAIFIFSQKLTFGTMGENVTLKIRRLLYLKMLEKHMAWFDEKENAPGQLSTVLASYT